MQTLLFGMALGAGMRRSSAARRPPHRSYRWGKAKKRRGAAGRPMTEVSAEPFADVSAVTSARGAARSGVVSPARMYRPCPARCVEGTGLPQPGTESWSHRGVSGGRQSRAPRGRRAGGAELRGAPIRAQPGQHGVDGSLQGHPVPGCTGSAPVALRTSCAQPDPPHNLPSGIREEY